jgi:hypothetical protein
VREWITFDATDYGVPTAVNMAQVAAVYFEEQGGQVDALVCFSTSDPNHDDLGETWFRITDRDGVEALRRYVNARRLEGFGPL